MRLSRVLLLVALIGLWAPAFAGGVAATVYRNPTCGCCLEHAKYLQAHGFDVTVVATRELPKLRAELGVPEHLAGCHLTRIGPYVFEGHMPVESIERVLREKPMVRGLSVPGMPPGSPGMGGARQGPLLVYYISEQMPPRLYEPR